MGDRVNAELEVLADVRQMLFNQAELLRELVAGLAGLRGIVADGLTVSNLPTYEPVAPVVQAPAVEVPLDGLLDALNTGLTRLSRDLDGALDKLGDRMHVQPTIARGGGNAYALTDSELRATPVDTEIHTNGSVVTSLNPLPVDVGANLNVTADFSSVVSTLNSTSTPLGANATFTGTWEDVLDYAAITAAILTDVDSATDGAVIQFSADGVDVLSQHTDTVIGGYPAAFPAITPEARYFRIIYTNGAIAQSTLEAQVSYSPFAPAVPIAPLGATITDGDQAAVVQSMIRGRHSSGAYVPVEVDATGALSVNATATDTYSGGEVLADQAGAGAVLTFTFTTPVNLAWVLVDGDDGRCDPFGGTPSSGAGIPCDDGVPQPVSMTVTTIKVYAPAATTVSVWGYRY